MNNAPDYQRQDDPPRYGPPNLDSWYETQRKEAAKRNGRDEQSLVRVAPPPAWEAPRIVSMDEKPENDAWKQESPQQPKRRERTGRQRLFVVAELVLAVSAALAGVLALAEWNKHKELAKLAKFRNEKGHYEERGKRIDVKKERHWGDRETLTTAAQSILRDQSALSLATDPAERILLEQRIQSNRESAANMLRNAHPFTRKILGAPDGNIETLLRKQESALKE